ncbi:MAG TPA: TldD/PmbA family protein [Desulfotomaculum sp.]|nr:TldD/PmbA family protein [Desulfotomaculum sp.]
MNASLLKAAKFTLEEAKKVGAIEAEVYLNEASELTIEVRNDKIETMKLARDKGLGLRVFTAGRTGFAFCTELTPEVMRDLTREAVANASQTSADPNNILPRKELVYPSLDLYDPEIRKAPVEEKVELARRTEKIARAYDARIKIIESSAYQDEESETLIVNSSGVAAAYQSASCGLFLAVVAQDAEDSQTGFALDYSLRYKDLNTQKVGEEASQRALRLLGAKPISTRKVAVVLEPYVTIGFLGLLGASLSAEAVQKKRSLFTAKINQRVAAQEITIIDDGTLPDGIGSCPFDGEGVPSQRTILIQDGVLQGFLHNTYTAAKAGVASTGNGMRPTFKSTPEVGTTNFFMQSGQLSPDELVKNISGGLLVTEVIGMHTANPISGDFSVGAAGILIEHGRLTQPVRGITIAGNILEFFNKIDGIGNDLTFLGSRGAPTIRVREMVVSGQ